MSSMIVRGGGIGRNAFGHTLASSEDDLEIHNGGKGRFAPRRKRAKLMKAAHSRSVRRRARIHSPGVSDSSEEEALDGGEGESVGNPDDSEDEDGEPNSFAPSGGAAGNKSKFRSRSRKNPLLRSISSGSVPRQAGRKGPSDHKSSSLSPTLRRHVARTPCTGNSAASPLSEDLSSTPSSPTRAAGDVAPDQSLKDDSSSDDETYDLLDLVSDSEEDDVDVEMLEEQALIQDVITTGDWSVSDFAEGDTMFPPGDNSFGDIIPDDFKNDYFMYSESAYETAPYSPTTREASVAAQTTVSQDQTTDRPMTPNAKIADTGNSPLHGTLIEAEQISQDVVTSPVQEAVSHELEELRKQTGLSTPSSLKQPLDLSNCDPEETEEDEPNRPDHLIPVSALRRRSGHIVASRLASGGIRKVKPKTPKTASWKISRKDLCMSHSKGKLLISGGSKTKKSGLNTPRGIVPVDPRKPTPLDLGLTLITQQLSDVQQASALLSATGSLTGPLFPVEVQAEAQAEIGVSSNNDHFDMTRFVDFQAKDH